LYLIRAGVVINNGSILITSRGVGPSVEFKLLVKPLVLVIGLILIIS